MPRLLDTNILLRYFTGSPPDKAEQARQLLQRIERREERVVTSIMVVFEIIFTLQRTYRVPKDNIQQMVGDLLSLPGIQLAGKRLLFQALSLYAQHKDLSFADAYNMVHMQAHGIGEIYSWDTDFDEVNGITRVEPY